MPLYLGRKAFVLRAFGFERRALIQSQSLGKALAKMSCRIQCKPRHISLPLCKALKSEDCAWSDLAAPPLFAGVFAPVVNKFGEVRYMDIQRAFLAVV